MGDTIDMKALENEYENSILELKKSLDIEEPEQLQKADMEKKKKRKYKESDEDEYEDGSEPEGEEEEEEYEETKKSIEGALGEDQEAEAAMDVEPFLKALVKGIDKRINGLEKIIQEKMDNIETLTKAQGSMLLSQATLQKALVENTEKIGNQQIPSQSVKGQIGERFKKSKDAGEIDYSKINTTELLKAGKIDLNTATVIDNRMNRGTIGLSGDNIDNLCKALVQEEK